MMKYYKLINDKNFIGVCTSHDLRKFQSKHKILLFSDENNAQYIQIDDKIYRDDWFAPIITDSVDYETVKVIAIEKEEYDILHEAVETGKEIEIPVDEPVIEEDLPPINHDDEITIEFVKTIKNAEMSNECNKSITSGFDVVLSDGESHHFSLTVQDQLNLITLSSMIESGAETIPYHADGELCRYYSAEDITVVINTATAHKTYHVTYFNSLKVYIEALENIEDISAIEYGVEIPQEYQSDILKSILASMSGGEGDETVN